MATQEEDTISTIHAKTPEETIPSLHVTQATLRPLLDNASFRTDGDSNEQQFGDLLAGDFPNCERFWKLFIVPLTERMAGYPTSLAKHIGFRPGMDDTVADIASAHYSMFMNLVYAHDHLPIPMPSSIDDFYVHLASACDLAENVLEKMYLLLLKCQGGETQLLQKLTRDQFLGLAGKWYDEHYPTLYEHYLSKGKFPPIKFPSRQDLLVEFVKEYLKQNHLWKEYAKHSQAIREIRNVIVHDVQIAKLVTVIVDGDQGGQSACQVLFIPKPQKIQDYRVWRKVFAVRAPDIIQRDFAPAAQQMQEDLALLKSILNRLWEAVIAELDKEFYQDERSNFRDLYRIKL